MLKILSAILLLSLAAFGETDFQTLEVQASQGDAQAQYAVGQRYREGDGVDKNLATAVEWIRKAADQNYGPAVVSMVYRYEKGEGVELDLDEATRWYEKALELGYTRDLKKQEELKNYTAIFAEMDAKLRSLPDATGEEYVEWVETAVRAKEKLKLTDEIDPWLEELTSQFSNHWKILRALAMGYHHATDFNGYWKHTEKAKGGLDIDTDELNRWRALKLMEKTHALAGAESAPEAEMATLTRDYLMILLMERFDYAHERLQLQTTVLTLNDLAELDNRAFADEPVFYARPDSPATALNDGELALTLLGQYDITLDDIVVPKEAQLPLAKTEHLMQACNARGWKQAEGEFFQDVADDEFWVWTNDVPRFAKLPEDYNYVPQLETLVEKNPEIIGGALGQIFESHGQLERAAAAYERAGDTNVVRSIRAPQGTFAPCEPLPTGVPVELEYRYRNAEEVAVELFRVKVGTNLLERLEAESVERAELDLLSGKLESIREAGGFDNTNRLEKVQSFAIALASPPDHRDATERINLGPLKAGTYFVRAKMKNGNTVETVLNIRDTMLYFTPTSSATTNDHVLFILCDARTGKPRPNETLTFLGKDLRILHDENGKCYLGHHREDGVTDSNGCYVLGGRKLSYPYPEFHALANLQGFPLVIDSSCHYLDPDPILRSQIPFVATDRPIYRPGDTANLMVWQVAETNNMTPRILGGDFELPILGDPSLRPNRFGAMKATFEIPEEAPLGVYDIEQEDGYPCARFQVEKYRAPAFEVAIQQLNDGRIEIAAEYAYGAPVAGGTLSGFVEFHESAPSPWYPTAPFDALWDKGYWWNGGQFSETENRSTAYHHSALIDEPLNLELNADGRAVIDIKTLSDGDKALAAMGWFSVSAHVTDAANMQYSADTHFPNNMKQEPPCCWMDKAFYEQGEKTVTHTRSEQDGDLTLHYERIEGSNAVAVGETKHLAPGHYQVRARDTAGAESEPFRFFVLGDAENGLTAEDPIRVVVEKGVYETDETAMILVQVDRPGRHVYFFDRLFGDNAFSIPRIFIMDETSKRIELPIHSDAGTWQFAAMTVVDGKLHMDAGRLYAIDPGKKTGRVEIESEKEQYQPGATVRMKVRALNTEGKGEPCAVAVTVYNKTLDALAERTYVNPIFNALFSTWLTDEYHYLRVNSSWPRDVSPTTPKWVMQMLGNRGLSTKNEDQSFGGDLFGDSVSWQPPSAEELGGAPGAAVHLRENLADHAYWNAFVETDENGEAVVEFPIPETLTEWKVIAWAVHTNYAASGETSFKCAKDLVVQLNTPRYMIEGDRLEISASVRNHTTNALTVSVRSSISILGSVIKDLQPAAEKLLYWKHKVRKPGTETIKVAAQSNRVGDGMSKPLPVLSRTMLKRGGDGGIVLPENSSAQIEINIPESVLPNSLNLELNASPNMLETVASALPFLAEYPHGCTEQTLNKFLPALVTLQTAEELGIELENRDEVMTNAKAGITRLEQAHARRWNQGWTWNLDADSGPEDPLVTAWLVRGLAAAAEHEELTALCKSPGRGVRHLVFQLNTAAAPPWKRKENDELTHADVLSAVVLRELGPEKWLSSDRVINIARELMPKLGPFFMKHAADFSLYGKVMTAYYLELGDETKLRDEMVAYIEQYLETDANLGTFWLRMKTDHWWRWYNDEIETMAWYLKLLNRVEPDSAKTAGVARWLLINRQHGDHWKSTRDTAICIEALCEYIVNHPSTAQDGGLVATLNGGPIADGLNPGRNTLALKTEEKHPLFYDATWSFQTLENPIAAERCDLVSVSRAYYRFNADGDRELVGADEMLKAGETIEVELTFEAPQELEYLLATDRKPAGFESVETQSGYRRGGLSHYQELHDERVAFYINRLPKGESRIQYRLRPEHAGTVSALPATIELMYAPDQAANSNETKLQITR